MAKRKIKKNFSMRLFIYVMLFVAIFISLLPIIILFLYSFNKGMILESPLELLNPLSITLDNYRRAFEFGEFSLYAKNSIIITFSALVFSLIVTSTFSFGLSKLSYKIKSKVSYFIISMRFIPYIILVMPFFLLFLVLRLSGTYIGIIVAHLALHLPLISWLLVSYFEDIPHEIEEAALVDGCNSFYVFWKFSLPIIRPGIVTAAIYTFIISWNEYLFGMILSGSNTKPLTAALSIFAGSETQAPEHNVIAAYSFFILLPIIIITFIASGLIVKGFTKGSLKG